MERARAEEASRRAAIAAALPPLPRTEAGTPMEEYRVTYHTFTNEIATRRVYAHTKEEAWQKFKARDRGENCRELIKIEKI